MSTVPQPVSAEQLAALPPGKRYELVKGELKMMSPAGGQHGLIAMQIGSMLNHHVRKHKLGRVFAAETGFRLATEPDTVRAPDVAFVGSGKMSTVENLVGYLPFAPDLAVEVVSPNDSFSAVESKAEMWLQSGCKMCLVVDPENQSVRVYRNTSVIEVLHSGDTLDANDVVEGWQVAVAEFFA